MVVNSGIFFCFSVLPKPPWDNNICLREGWMGYLWKTKRKSKILTFKQKCLKGTFCCYVSLVTDYIGNKQLNIRISMFVPDLWYKFGNALFCWLRVSWWKERKKLCSNERYIQKIQNDTNIVFVLWVILV